MSSKQQTMASEGGSNPQHPRIDAFLETYRIDTTACSKFGSPSHTAFGRINGAYKIPLADNSDFFRIYAQDTLRGVNKGVCLVERHRDFGPIVIDLDFRYPVPVSNFVSRKHDHETIDRFLREYTKVLATWVRIPDDGFDVFIMERSSARVEKGKVKDGVHIIIPEIVTECSLQLRIQRDALAVCDSVFTHLGLSNSIEDIFDEAVIQRNGWILLGSSKPDIPPYCITRVTRVRLDSSGFSRTNIPFVTPETPVEFGKLVQRLSIRCSDESHAAAVHPARQAEVMQMKKCRWRRTR